MGFQNKIITTYNKLSSTLLYYGTNKNTKQLLQECKLHIMNNTMTCK